MTRAWMLAAVMMLVLSGAAQADPWDDDDDDAYGDDTIVVVQDWAPPVIEQMPSPSEGETVVDPRGRTCREYQTSATIEGKRQRLYGTACRQADGSWKFER